MIKMSNNIKLFINQFNYPLKYIMLIHIDMIYQFINSSKHHEDHKSASKCKNMTVMTASYIFNKLVTWSGPLKTQC